MLMPTYLYLSSDYSFLSGVATKPQRSQRHPRVKERFRRIPSIEQTLLTRLSLRTQPFRHLQGSNTDLITWPFVLVTCFKISDLYCTRQSSLRKVYSTQRVNKCFNGKVDIKSNMWQCSNSMPQQHPEKPVNTHCLTLFRAMKCEDRDSQVAMTGDKVASRRQGYVPVKSRAVSK